MQPRPAGGREDRLVQSSRRPDLPAPSSQHRACSTSHPPQGGAAQHLSSVSPEHLMFLENVHSQQKIVKLIWILVSRSETRTSMNWLSASQAYQSIAKLLGLPQYQYQTLLGLTVSVGGMTLSTVSQWRQKDLQSAQHQSALKLDSGFALKLQRFCLSY